MMKTAFNFSRGIDRETGPWLGVQTGFGNLLPGHVAHTVGLLLNALQGRIDLVQELSLGFGHSECQILIEGIGSDVSHVNGHVRKVSTLGTKRFIFHPIDETEQSSPLTQKKISIEVELLLGHLGLSLGLDLGHHGLSVLAEDEDFFLVGENPLVEIIRTRRPLMMTYPAASGSAAAATAATDRLAALAENFFLAAFFLVFFFAAFLATFLVAAFLADLLGRSFLGHFLALLRHLLGGLLGCTFLATFLEHLLSGLLRSLLGQPSWARYLLGRLLGAFLESFWSFLGTFLDAFLASLLGGLLGGFLRLLDAFLATFFEAFFLAEVFFFATRAHLLILMRRNRILSV